MKKSLRIVFMGTPEFAVASLDALLKAGFEVAAVVTAPDKPAGRGRKLSFSAVKKYALAHDLELLQPSKLKDPGFLSVLKNLNTNLFVVVAFRMLPEVVWSMPQSGTFNLHASLLPQYRGAAPINHVIINGEKETGVTTFFINDKIDTGNIIFQEKTPVYPDETAGELHDRLMEMGAKLVVKTARAIESGNYQIVPQSVMKPQGGLKPAPKIFKNDCLIRWNDDVEKVYNFIRGLSPYPAAFSHLVTGEEKIPVKIFKVRPTIGTHGYSPGIIQTNNKDLLAVFTANGKIFIEQLQMAGRKRMSATEFLNGFKIREGWFFA